MSEFEWIARYFAPLAMHGAALGLRDDAASLPGVPGCDIVISTDTLVAGVHFLGDETPGDIARKALRVNLSDLAAKGADPLGYFLNLSLPCETNENWVAGFAEGLRQDQAEFSLSLLGGDTTSTPGPLTISITALGTVPAGAMIHRNGAQAGDDIYVTGTLGDGAAGLDVARGVWRVAAQEAGSTFHVSRTTLLNRYRTPQPRLAVGLRLRGIAHAAMDISDGLAQDISHLCAASGVGAVVDAARIPRRNGVTLEQAVTGGDDYEILFTAPASAAVRMPEISEETGVSITRIGKIQPGREVVIHDAQGKSLHFAQPGWRHF